ncbi:PP2C family protein-serine/threonine phosphatase [Candidatus Ruminimicrobium bovinum]|uniref:PP2C family protein-serine/threonine phosphatase n=1 Tax=Candidatus Ruminimicrobium bovinum TaxID=3242779 RepID=UPI0039B92FFA
MKIIGTSKTDVGKIRTENQDAFGFWQNESLYFVCDGMGGGASGDFASKMAVDVIYNAYKLLSKEDIYSLVDSKYSSFDENILKPIACLKLANRTLCNLQKRYPKLKGMGTTAVGAFFEKETSLLHIYNVGDSRIYRIRNGNIKQLTEDHSKVQELLSKGKMTQADAKTAEFQSMITRALGTAEKLKVDYKSEVVKNGDIYIFCSDGLNGEIDDDHIKDIVCLNKSNLNDVANELILAANNAGGRDNTTVIVLNAEDDDSQTIIPQNYHENILLFDEETQTEILKEETIIKNIEKNFTVPVPKKAKMGRLYTNPFLLALCLVLLFLVFFSFFSKVVKEEKKDISELTGNVSGISLRIKTINESTALEISEDEDRISKMQMIQDAINDKENLLPLSKVSISIISLSDGQQKYSGYSDTDVSEINLPNDKYELSLTYSGYKILDQKDMVLTDSVEIQTQNSMNLTNADIIMVPETLFEVNENSETENENIESVENENNNDN